MALPKKRDIEIDNSDEKSLKKPHTNDVLSNDDEKKFTASFKRLLVEGRNNEQLFIRHVIMGSSMVLKSTYTMEKPNIKNENETIIGYANDPGIPVKAWLCVESILQKLPIFIHDSFNFGHVLYLLHKYAFPKITLTNFYCVKKPRNPHITDDVFKFIVNSNYTQLSDDDINIDDLIQFIKNEKVNEDNWLTYGIFINNISNNKRTKFIKYLYIITQPNE